MVGQYTSNFEDIMSELLRHNAICIAQDAVQAIELLVKAINDDEDLTAMANRAKQMAIEDCDVLQRYMSNLMS